MKLELFLKSDAIPGSGEGLAGVIDTDINYDDFGIPYIPAKRIKGILREAARDLIDVDKLDYTCSDIFGKSGNDESCSFRISNGYVENYESVRSFLQTYRNQKKLTPILNREAVLTYYTYTRSQTAINEQGTAKKNSLRTFRVLKKHLTFHFDIDYDPKFDIDMKLICQVVRHFGISRTRGMGEISLKINGSRRAMKKKSTYIPNTDKNKTRIELTIHNLSQLLVCDQVGESQNSEPYIPASFILGAFANTYINNKKKLKSKGPHTDTNFVQLFLNGSTKYSNGYLVEPKRKACIYPAPASIVKEKDKNNYFDLLLEKDLEKLENEKIQTKGRIGDFVYISGKTVDTMSTSIENEYHHSRPENDRSIGHAREGNGEFFQFAAMSPRQYFKSYISGDKAMLAEIMGLLHERSIFYLGKSKTAQYGKCKISGRWLENNSTQTEDWNDSNVITITCISDMILRNENGFYEPNPEYLRNEIAQLCGLKPNQFNHLKIIEKQQYLVFKQLGGYLGVWNMPKIQTTALAAGSVVQIENKSGTSFPINAIENHAYGCRTEEGFGQIKVNWHGQNSIKVNPPLKPIRINSAEGTFGKTLLIHILNRKLDNLLKAKAVEKAKKLISEGRNPKNSFIGKMELIVKNASDFSEIIKCIKEFRKPAKSAVKNIAISVMITPDTKAVNVHQFCELISDFELFTKNASLEQLTNELEIKEFYMDSLFTFYQSYALQFLLTCRLANRKEATHANG